MAEITLADYAGYIFREMIRAREMADAYSKGVAEAYAKDEVMRHFSVPRFRVPTMQLTIPVLISGARFAQTVRFVMTEEAFLKFISAKVNEIVVPLRTSTDGLFRPRPRVKPEVLEPRIRTRPEIVTRGGPAVVERRIATPMSRAPEETVASLANDFWEQLAANPDPSKPDPIVQDMWTRIFERALADAGLVDQYKASDPENKLLHRSFAEVLQTVRNNTAVDGTDIKSLLVNPETQMVKEGSSDASVFVMKVDMTEEGFYIRAVKDDETGQVRPLVEFE